MKVLLIDNKSAHLERLQQLVTDKLGPVELTLRDPRDMTADDVQATDLVIISGGVGRSIAKNPMTFQRVIGLISEQAKPTIGICLGAEAIAAAYGAELLEMPVRRVGNIRVHMTPDFAAETNMAAESFMAYEFHKWRIGTLPKSLQTLATSKDGPEVFRHASLPLWGLQFHPEVRRLDNEGHKIFTHILSTFH